MKRSETRYRNVWDSGYRAGLDEASAALFQFVKAGGSFDGTGAGADSNIVYWHMLNKRDNRMGDSNARALIRSVQLIVAGNE